MQVAAVGAAGNKARPPSALVTDPDYGVADAKPIHHRPKYPDSVRRWERYNRKRQRSLNDREKNLLVSDLKRVASRMKYLDGNAVRPVVRVSPADLA